MHIKDLEKIAKVVEKFSVEFYNEHKEEIDAIIKEVEKLEKEETTSHIHTKAMSPDELITQMIGVCWVWKMIAKEDKHD